MLQNSETLIQMLRSKGAADIVLVGDFAPEAAVELAQRLDRARLTFTGPRLAGDDAAYLALKDRLASFGERVAVAPAVSALPETDFDVVAIDGQLLSTSDNLSSWFDRLPPAGLLLGGAVAGSDEQSHAVTAGFCQQQDLCFYVIDGIAVVHKPEPRLQAWRNKHVGERVFIIGNGGSLNQTDLDLIAGEHAIAMNRISLIYGRTTWRPSYYLFVSDNVRHPTWGRDWTDSVNQAVSEPGTTSFVWDSFTDLVEDSTNVQWLSTVTERPLASDGTFSTNIAQYISKTGTTMNTAFQLAYHLGFSQVVLLGADLSWVTTTGTEKDANHFDPSYSAQIPDGERERRRMRLAHQYAYPHFLDAGRQVLNATVDTWLDTYPLADYERLARHKGLYPLPEGHDDDTPRVRALRERMSDYWQKIDGKVS